MTPLDTIRHNLVIDRLWSLSEMENHAPRAENHEALLKEQLGSEYQDLYDDVKRDLFPQHFGMWTTRIKNASEFQELLRVIHCLDSDDFYEIFGHQYKRLLAKRDAFDDTFKFISYLDHANLIALVGYSLCKLRGQLHDILESNYAQAQDTYQSKRENSGL